MLLASLLGARTLLLCFFCFRKHLTHPISDSSWVRLHPFDALLEKDLRGLLTERQQVLTRRGQPNLAAEAVSVFQFLFPMCSSSNQSQLNIVIVVKEDWKLSVTSSQTADLQLPQASTPSKTYLCSLYMSCTGVRRNSNHHGVTGRQSKSMQKHHATI